MKSTRDMLEAFKRKAAAEGVPAEPTERAPKPAAPIVEEPRARNPQELAQLVRKLEMARSRNAAVTLMVGMAGGPKKRERLELLLAIDGACEQRGRILPEEAIARDRLARQLVAELGYDPRLGEWKAPTSHLPPKLPLQLSAGERWLELWRKVEAGKLSEAEACSIGMQWVREGR